MDDLLTNFDNSELDRYTVTLRIYKSKTGDDTLYIDKDAYDIYGEKLNNTSALRTSINNRVRSDFWRIFEKTILSNDKKINYYCTVIKACNENYVDVKLSHKNSDVIFTHIINNSKENLKTGDIVLLNVPQADISDICINVKIKERNNEELKKAYGIDYNTYVCVGIANSKVAVLSHETELFDIEVEMITRLGELKSENRFGDIKLFTCVPTFEKKEYKL